MWETQKMMVTSISSPFLTLFSNGFFVDGEIKSRHCAVMDKGLNFAVFMTCRIQLSSRRVRQ